MPNMSPITMFGEGGARLNQKHHLEMTEEEKALVARCDGIKHDHVCKNPVFRCTACGNYGCDQEVADKCAAQGFKNGKCLHCGATGTCIPVMKKELAGYKLAWDKEVELARKK